MVDEKLHTTTPDELFDEFSEISVSLSDNTSSWTLQLCSSYLLALTSDLSEAVTAEKTFVMPNVSTLTTKALQLTALRTVRSQASASYRELLKEQRKMTSLLRNLNTTQNRGLDLSTHRTQGHQQNNSSHGQIFYPQGPSQADNTLQRYNGGGQDNTTLLRNVPYHDQGHEQNNSSHGKNFYQQGPSKAENTLQRYNGGEQVPNPHDVETRKHTGTGLQHPYDKERDFLSRFPVGFNGCYNCGQTDH